MRLSGLARFGFGASTTTTELFPAAATGAASVSRPENAGTAHVDVDVSDCEDDEGRRAEEDD